MFLWPHVYNTSDFQLRGDTIIRSSEVVAISKAEDRRIKEDKIIIDYESFLSNRSALIWDRAQIHKLERILGSTSDMPDISVSCFLFHLKKDEKTFDWELGPTTKLLEGFYKTLSNIQLDDPHFELKDTRPKIKDHIKKMNKKRLEAEIEFVENITNHICNVERN